MLNEDVAHCQLLDLNTLLGLYRMDYTDLGNIHWPLLLKLAKASRRFL